MNLSRQSVSISTATAPCPSFPVLPICPSSAFFAQGGVYQGGSPLIWLRARGFTHGWPRWHVQSDGSPASTVYWPSQSLSKTTQTQGILIEEREGDKRGMRALLPPQENGCGLAQTIICASSISTQTNITSSLDLLSQWQEHITRDNRQTGVILDFPWDTFRKTGLRAYRYMHHKRLHSGFIVHFSFLSFKASKEMRSNNQF